MLEQVVSHRVLDVARNANDETAHEKPENALTNGQSDDYGSVRRKLLACDRLPQAVDRVTRDPRAGQKEQIRQQDAESPRREPAAVPPEVNRKAPQEAPSV